MKRTTWILVIMAILCGTFVYFNESYQQKKKILQVQSQKIFTFQEKEIRRLIIEKKGQTLEFVKNPEITKTWLIQQPKEAVANEATISFLTDLLVNSKSDRSFTISSDQLALYGLDKPLAKITIELQNQTTHQLILGKPSFDNQFIYAKKDQESQEIFLVKIDFKYAVEKEIQEWQASDNSEESQ